MDKTQRKRRRREKAHQRVRANVAGTSDRPRLAVYKSSRYIYVQVIDDLTGQTLVQANSRESGVTGKVDSAKTKAAARLVGEMVGERAKEKGIVSVVFDRGGYRFHGRVKEVAEGARSKGLQF